MSQENIAIPEQRVLANRSGISRKLLARKARARAGAPLCDQALESAFPTPCSDLSLAASDAAPKLRNIRHALELQLLRPGHIQPNPNTVIATIVRVVVERGQLSRGDLIDQMRDTAFPHPLARPHDQRWCKGYVAGSIRQGFLAVVCEASDVSTSERSIIPTEEL